MTASDGVRWYCPNRDCNWSFVGTTGTDVAPHCVCGKQMRRGDAVPAFHYLDFLRESSVENEALEVEKE